MKLSDLRTAAEIHEQDMRDDPEYRAEHERTKLANDVAIRVLAYRTENGMWKRELARRLGTKQPNIARLESGEHEPSLSTLMRLSLLLGLDFNIEIRAGGLKLRRTPAARKRPRVTVLVHKTSGKVVRAKAPVHRGGYVLTAARARSLPGEVHQAVAARRSVESL